MEKNSKQGKFNKNGGFYASQEYQAPDQKTTEKITDHAQRTWFGEDPSKGSLS